MTEKFAPTWVVVMDSTVAHFYALRKDDAGRHLEVAAEEMRSGLHRHSSDLKSDEPGRAFRAGGSAARHAMEPRHDYHKLEKHDFVHAVCLFLENAFDDHAFERLVIVAPERALGEFRHEISDKMRRTIRHEVAKDLTKLGPQDLWVRLSSVFDEASPSDRH